MIEFLSILDVDSSSFCFRLMILPYEFRLVLKLQ